MSRRLVNPDRYDPVTVAVPCAMCGGQGCEPVVTPAGKLDLQPCWWCSGRGHIDVPEGMETGPGPACG